MKHERSLNMEVLIFMVKAVGIIGFLIIGALIYDIVQFYA